MKKILVTGGSGFIGSHLADELNKRGCEVTIFDKTPPRNNTLKYIPGDISDYELLRTSVNGHDTVCHLAAMVGVVACLSNAEEVFRINLEAVKKLAEICNQCSVENLLFASSSEVYGNGSLDRPLDESMVLNPITPYGQAKKAAEEFLNEYSHNTGMKITAVRYCNIYGPGQRIEFVIPIFIDKVIKNQPIPVCGNGSQVRSYTFVNDAVDGTIKAMTRSSNEFQVYNISSQDTITVKNLAERIININGQGTIEYVSFEDINRDSKREILVRIPLPRKAEDLLGFKAKTPFDEGLKITFDFYKNSNTQIFTA